ncbi:MAG: hypothetical protein HQ541_23330 [Mariniphaga sp.]|nr:hypothetical protein [Mariniphaga sp.]
MIDKSHNKTLNEDEFNKLFLNNSIKITNKFRLSVDLNMVEYLLHASQDNDTKLAIQKKLDAGLKDKRVSEFLFIKNNEIYFKRPVYLILGIK